MKSSLKQEAKAVEKGEEKITQQEKDTHEGGAAASRLIETGHVQAVSAAQDKVMQQIKPLGAAVKADHVRTAGTRTVRAAKSAFRQGMAFGWPWGAAIGAAAAVATAIAGKAIISRISRISFEEGGPVPGPRSETPSQIMAKKAGLSRARRYAILPTVNIEVEGEADEAALGHIQESLDAEMEYFARNLELSRSR